MTTTPRLRDFQETFAAALASETPNDTLNGPLVMQPGFAVYRNTVMKGCVDALLANYPSVARIVGDDWLRAAAAVFARRHLPRQPSLLEYGEEFPTFLEAFEPAAELPYLGGVARLDRYWIESHVAADAEPLRAAVIAEIGDRVSDVVLRPHPAARWVWFEGLPIYSIWRNNRDGANAAALAEIAWRGEGALLVRPSDRVDAIEISAAENALLDACARDELLVDAGLAALAIEPDIDLTTSFTRLLLAGAFAAEET